MRPMCGVCGAPLTADWMDPPTFSLQEVAPGVVRPVLSKPIRMDPESGAVCWCARSGRPVLDTGGPMSAVVYRPDSPHRCRMVPDVRNREIKIPGGTATVPMADFDPPGTVRACTECGRTWVSYRFPPQGGYAAGYDIRWRREGRLARWWRERRQRPAAA